MAKLSKRVRAFRDKVDANHSYPVEEAVALLKEFGTVKFNETVEVAVNLGANLLIVVTDCVCTTILAMTL